MEDDDTASEEFVQEYDIDDEENEEDDFTNTLFDEGSLDEDDG